MATVLVLYNTPTNPAAFNEYYAGTHIPIAKKIPGLRSYKVSKGAIAIAAGGPALHLVAELIFDDMAALQAGLASPEAAAATADVPNFASGGVSIYTYDDVEV